MSVARFVTLVAMASLAPGVYFLRLVAGGERATQKLVLAR